MEMWNISRIGEGLSKAITIFVVVAVSSCASIGKRGHVTKPVSTTSPVDKTKGETARETEVYGPFLNGDVTPIPGPAAPAEVVSNPDRIVLVLGRGLTHGFAYVGVLRALSELKIPIQSIYATEVGALAAALYYTQPNPNRIDWALLHFTEKNLGPPSGKFSFRIKSPESDLDGKLKEVFGERRVETTNDQLHILLEDAKTKEALEAKSGDLWRALRGALAGANHFSPTDFEGRSVHASARKLSEEYRMARQVQKYPIVVVAVGPPPTELFRKLVEEERSTLIYVPLEEIDDLDLKKKNQAVFSGKNAVHKAAKEILSLVGRKPE